MSLPEKMKRMPGTFCICIDENLDTLVKGRLFHEYSKQPVQFCDFPKLLQIVESHIDCIQFPEPTVIFRSFKKCKVDVEPVYSIMKKEQTIDEVCGNRGNLRTVIISVEGRHSSTWQGEAYCVEQDVSIKFSSELEIINFLSNI